MIPTRDAPDRGATARFETGIAGFDEIAGGGLPVDRVTVVMGPAGSGKTLFALEMLARGAAAGRPGLFVAFEEPPSDVARYAEGFAWPDAPAGSLEFVDARLPATVLQSGDFDLNGLLTTLSLRCRERGVKRVVFDGVDVLLAHLDRRALVRQEVFRLREWVLDTGISAIVTAKTDARGRLASDQDFLQFMADCVVGLQFRMAGRTAVRGLRVVKYRGASHSANEFAFAFTRTGLEVVTTAGPEIDHRVLDERVSSGVAPLDQMLGGGYYRASSILVSGAPGTAKTTLAGAFAEAACRRGERTLFVSFDEMGAQIVRNLASVDIDLGSHVATGMLRLCSLRTRTASAEAHLVRIRSLLREHEARNLVIDPISALGHVGEQDWAEQTAVQLVDGAKASGITVFGTTLLATTDQVVEATPLGLSTYADTWMHLAYVNQGGERNRALTIIKSRGMGHSNQVRELILSDDGITIADVYSAGGEVLMGTLRWEREQAQREAELIARREADRRRREAELSLAEVEVRLRTLEHELEVRRAELERIRDEERRDLRRQDARHVELLRRRGAAIADDEGGRGDP